MAKDLKMNWDRRQKKTELQDATITTFSQIHENANSAEFEFRVERLKVIISSLPPDQSELFEIQKCYPGIMDWNKYSLINIHSNKPKLEIGLFVDFCAFTSFCMM